MIRIAIVEDETEYIEQLTEYLREYEKSSGETFDTTVFRDGDAIASTYKSQFDIILMDIQLKFVDGMTAAEEIRRVDSQVIIIFITSMTQYAIRGYRVNAFDYIVKPVAYFAFRERLGMAISRLKRRTTNYITIPIRGGVLRIDTSDIFYIESQGHDLIYHTANDTYLSSESMKSAEEKLKNSNFSRGNKCYLINLEHVDGIQQKCAIVKGQHLQLSRPRMNAFMQDLTRYWGEKQ